MSIRAHDNAKPPTPPKITRWPAPPGTFTEDERAAWERIGPALLELGTVCRADLLRCERLAQVRARADRALADPEFKPTALNALLLLEAALMREFGLSPLARRGVAPLPSGKGKKSGFEDVE